jgi:pimeloyl-ACP methyl ester carboxylesterase
MPDVQSTTFSLSSLADRGLLTTRQLADFQDSTGLADFAWQFSWNRSALAEARGNLRTLMRRTQGCVVFMHGWCGNRSVWEQLPEIVCAANSRLVALTPDLNGFGGSPFLSDVPALEQCEPSAVVSAVVHWIELLGLRSGAQASRRRRVITFVGHAMSGAALFYLRPNGWHVDEYARCALSPSLLMDDVLRHNYYQALGTTSWSKTPVEELRARVSARIVENLTAGAGDAVQAEHVRTFEETPRGTVAQTFYAMGAPSVLLEHADWRNFHVFLGQDDPFLKVSRMVNLLDSLGLGPHQIQVLRGDHFLFSGGGGRREIHLMNREILVGQILYLHEACRERQRSG